MAFGEAASLKALGSLRLQAVQSQLPAVNALHGGLPAY